MRRGGRPPRRRTNFTGRAAVLAVVVCAIVLSLAYPLREYVAQRAEIAQLRQDNQELREDIAALRKQKRRLDDPAHIRRLARERLHFVMPGQTNYIVLDGSEGDQRAGAGSQADAERPWFVSLWRSVEKADGRRQQP